MTLLMLFVVFLVYYHRTDSVRIDKLFYESSVRYMHKKVFYNRDLPLPYMLLAGFVTLTNTLALRSTSVLLAFNALAAGMHVLNVAITYGTLRKLMSAKSSCCGVLLFYTSSFFINKAAMLNSLLVTFTFFNVCVFLIDTASYRRMFLFSFFGGLLLACSWMALIPLAAFAIHSATSFYSKACDPKTHAYRGFDSIVVNFFARAVLLALPFAMYVAIFKVFLSNQVVYTQDVEHFSIGYRAGVNHVVEPCDRFVLDRALVAILSRDTRSYVECDEHVRGGRVKTVGAIWRLIKIHIESSPDFNPNGEESSFVRNGDYVKLVHLSTEKYLRVADSTDTDAKFTSVDIRNTQETTDDRDYWQIRSGDELVEARKSLFVLRHVATGKELGVKANGVDVCVSTVSKKGLRQFYIEDAYNEDYYKQNYKDPRVALKSTGFSPLGFIRMFAEFNAKIRSDTKEHPLNWAVLGVKGDDLSRTLPAEIVGSYFLWRVALFLFVLYPAVLVANDVFRAKFGTGLWIKPQFYLLYIQWVLLAASFLFFGTNVVYFFYLSIVVLADFIARASDTLFMVFTGMALATQHTFLVIVQWLLAV